MDTDYIKYLEDKHVGRSSLSGTRSLLRSTSPSLFVRLSPSRRSTTSLHESSRLSSSVDFDRSGDRELERDRERLFSTTQPASAAPARIFVESSFEDLLELKRMMSEQMHKTRHLEDDLARFARRNDELLSYNTQLQENNARHELRIQSLLQEVNNHQSALDSLVMSTSRMESLLSSYGLSSPAQPSLSLPSETKFVSKELFSSLFHDSEVEFKSLREKLSLLAQSDRERQDLVNALFLAILDLKSDRSQPPQELLSPLLSLAKEGFTDRLRAVLREALKDGAQACVLPQTNVLQDSLKNLVTVSLRDFQLRQDALYRAQGDRVSELLQEVKKVREEVLVDLSRSLSACVERGETLAQEMRTLAEANTSLTPIITAEEKEALQQQIEALQAHARTQDEDRVSLTQSLHAQNGVVAQLTVASERHRSFFEERYNDLLKEFQENVFRVESLKDSFVLFKDEVSKETWAQENRTIISLTDQVRVAQQAVNRLQSEWTIKDGIMTNKLQELRLEAQNDVQESHAKLLQSQDEMLRSWRASQQTQETLLGENILSRVRVEVSKSENALNDTLTARAAQWQRENELTQEKMQLLREEMRREQEERVAQVSTLTQERVQALDTRLSESLSLYNTRLQEIEKASEQPILQRRIQALEDSLSETLTTPLCELREKSLSLSAQIDALSDRTSRERERLIVDQTTAQRENENALKALSQRVDERIQTLSERLDTTQHKLHTESESLRLSLSTQDAALKNLQLDLTNAEENQSNLRDKLNDELESVRDRERLRIREEETHFSQLEDAYIRRCNEEKNEREREIGALRNALEVIEDSLQKSFESKVSAVSLDLSQWRTHVEDSLLPSLTQSLTAHTQQTEERLSLLSETLSQSAESLHALSLSLTQQKDLQSSELLNLEERVRVRLTESERERRESESEMRFDLVSLKHAVELIQSERELETNPDNNHNNEIETELCAVRESVQRLSESLTERESDRDRLLRVEEEVMKRIGEEEFTKLKEEFTDFKDSTNGDKFKKEIEECTDNLREEITVKLKELAQALEESSKSQQSELRMEFPTICEEFTKSQASARREEFTQWLEEMSNSKDLAQTLNDLSHTLSTTREELARTESSLAELVARDDSDKERELRELGEKLERVEEEVTKHVDRENVTKLIEEYTNCTTNDLRGEITKLKELTQTLEESSKSKQSELRTEFPTICEEFTKSQTSARREEFTRWLEEMSDSKDLAQTLNDLSHNLTETEKRLAQTENSLAELAARTDDSGSDSERERELRELGEKLQRVEEEVTKRVDRENVTKLIEEYTNSTVNDLRAEITDKLKELTQALEESSKSQQSELRTEFPTICETNAQASARREEFTRWLEEMSDSGDLVQILGNLSHTLSETNKRLAQTETSLSELTMRKETPTITQVESETPTETESSVTGSETEITLRELRDGVKRLKENLSESVIERDSDRKRLACVEKEFTDLRDSTSQEKLTKLIEESLNSFDVVRREELSKLMLNTSTSLPSSSTAMISTEEITKVIEEYTKAKDFVRRKELSEVTEEEFFKLTQEFIELKEEFSNTGTSIEELTQQTETLTKEMNSLTERVSQAEKSCDRLSQIDLARTTRSPRETESERSLPVLREELDALTQTLTHTLAESESERLRETQRECKEIAKATASDVMRNMEERMQRESTEIKNCVAAIAELRVLVETNRVEVESMAHDLASHSDAARERERAIRSEMEQQLDQQIEELEQRIITKPNSFQGQIDALHEEVQEISYIVGRLTNSHHSSPAHSATHSRESDAESDAGSDAGSKIEFRPNSPSHVHVAQAALQNSHSPIQSSINSHSNSPSIHSQGFKMDMGEEEDSVDDIDLPLGTQLSGHSQQDSFHSEEEEDDLGDRDRESEESISESSFASDNESPPHSQGSAFRPQSTQSLNRSHSANVNVEPVNVSVSRTSSRGPLGRAFALQATLARSSSSPRSPVQSRTHSPAHSRAHSPTHVFTQLHIHSPTQSPTVSDRERSDESDSEDDSFAPDSPQTQLPHTHSHTHVQLAEQSSLLENSFDDDEHEDTHGDEGKDERSHKEDEEDEEKEDESAYTLPNTLLSRQTSARTQAPQGMSITTTRLPAPEDSESESESEHEREQDSESESESEDTSTAPSVPLQRNVQVTGSFGRRSY